MFCPCRSQRLRSKRRSLGARAASCRSNRESRARTTQEPFPSPFPTSPCDPHQLSEDPEHLFFSFLDCHARDWLCAVSTFIRIDKWGRGETVAWNTNWHKHLGFGCVISLFHWFVQKQTFNPEAVRPIRCYCTQEAWFYSINSILLLKWKKHSCALEFRGFIQPRQSLEIKKKTENKHICITVLSISLCYPVHSNINSVSCRDKLKYPKP